MLKHAMGQRWWEKFEPVIDEISEGRELNQVWRNLPPGIKEILGRQDQQT